MRKTLLIGFLASLLLSSCKSSIDYVDGVNARQPSREVPYKQFKQKKSTTYAAIILPDYPDTVKLEQSALTQMLKKEGYDIFIVAKPGETADVRNGIDSRDNRIEDVSSIFFNEAHGYQHYILMGFGEGAYIVPYLRHHLKIDTSIAVNMNPYSPLAAYEQWLTADSLSDYQLTTLAMKNVANINELHTRIEGVKKDPNGADKLAPSTNRQWMSYYNAPAYYDVLGTLEPLFWINFEQYPMISKAHQKEASLFCDIPFATFTSLPGKGNLNNEEQMILLVDKLREIVSYK